MPYLEMKGPYKLDQRRVDAEVRPGNMGSFALGRTEGTEFHVGYVGRSEDDLHAELSNHLDDARYTHFKFTYHDSPQEAYELQCRDYHRFQSDGLENDGHPEPPEGTDLACPVDGCGYGAE